MKEKKLYSTSIIPNDLYVYRDADRKLKEVILRMSKPAYISVARQMGKTNLLIQTKRALENETNRYVYIDITNKFESAQDCFRYIVNQILNSNEDLSEFQEAKENIVESRKTSTNNPTEEYQNEIREILKRFRGNLIIFLDEVDDLRKHSFSDDVFGQIRKTYFINETYPVLKRITYVLSGVIDPEKLIKTKENSPFNIAIPIYLEDFKYEEFLEFINKSELIIENEIKEHIYDWLKGNPRMTFEILSILEDEFIKGNQITKDLVDKVINDFYLTSFKNPPIDHIRDLIKYNTEVRKALIQLKKGNLEELSDGIINKLYLFGITSSKINKQNITIKNRVIELSLSDTWLEKVELEKKGYYEVGKEKFKNKEYKEAIRYFKEYIENDPKGHFVNFAKFNIGESYYLMKEYGLSNQFLLEKPINENYPELYFTQLFYIGVNYLRQNKANESITFFEDVVNKYTNPNLILTSKLNLGEISIIQNKIGDGTSEKIFLSALDYLNDNVEKIEEKNYYYRVIFYRLGFINQLSRAKRNEALEFFEKALEYSRNEDKPVILLYIDSCLDNNLERRITLYKELTELIIYNKIVFKEQEEILISFNELQLFLILSNLSEFELQTEFENLIQYSLNSLYSNKLKEYELIHKIAVYSVNNGNLNAGNHLFNKLLTYTELELKIQKDCHQIIGLIYHNKPNASQSIFHLENYIRLFNENNNFNEQIQLVDFNAFINIIDHYQRTKKYRELFNTASIIERYIDDSLSYENKANSAVIFFYILDYYTFIGNIPQATLYGEKVLSLISEVKPVLNELSYVDKKGLDNIEKQTKSMLLGLNRVKPIVPFKVEREPGRNEYVKVKYKNGSIVTLKYKKVIDDIRKGECSLVKN